MEKQLTDDDFYEKYLPEFNQVLLPKMWGAPEDMCSFCGCMYETYGEELEYVEKQPNINIWTIVDNSDEDSFSIVAGFHRVNRFGYLVTPTPWESENEEYLCEQ